MKRILLLLVFAIGLGHLGWGQVTLPHLDPLNYTVGQGLQTQTGWTTLNTGDALLITAGNLSYTGLPSSTGNKVTFDAAGIDAAKLFTQQTSGTVYYSFILNVTALGSLSTTGGYFTGLNEGTASTFGSTVWTRSDGTGYDVGLNPRTTAANTVWSSGTTTLNSTLFIVISYQIVVGATNDVVKMWINPTPGGTEPTATLTATNSLTDLANINRIFIRQDGTSATPFIEMDELRIGTTWADVAASSGPSITLTPTSLSGFTYILGSGPSTEQSFTASGTNLTNDISIAPSTNYEISTGTGGGFVSTNPIVLTQTGGTVGSTTIYTRLIAGLPVATYNGELIAASSTGATTQNVTCNGSVTYAPEPSNHPTSFVATTNSSSQITTTWTDNNGAQPASGFLVMANTTGTFTSPVDGTAQTTDTDLSDNAGVQNIAPATGSAVWNSGLNPGTAYYYKIFAYNGSGSTINYKTDGVVPTANASTLSLNDNTSEVSGPSLVGQPNLTLLSSLVTTEGAAVRVFDMDVWDYGPDAQTTKITQVTIKAGSNNTANWANNIAGVRLSLDAGTTWATIGTPVITASSMVIPVTSGTLDILNNNSATVSLYVYLKSTGIVDNAILEFKVDQTAASHGWLSDAVGSGFLTTFATAPVSKQILIDVVPTKLLFVQQPSNTVETATMTPAVTIEATDANGNRDLDNAGSVSLVSSGTMTGPVTATLASGFGTFGSIVHTATGTGLTLTASKAPLTDAISNTFDITTSTFTWIGGSGAWTTAANWSPTRTTPSTADILQFNDGGTYTITAVPTQTIATMVISGNSKITFQAGATATLTIGGGTGTDLSVGTGCELNVSGANALIIAVATGAVGNINGTMTFAGGVHKLTAVDAGGITFNSGSTFTSGTGFSSNAFGTTSLNSIHFGSGSSYINGAGSNPFGASAPNSVVVFQSGSLFKQIVSGTPSFAGRTYANFEMDAVSQIITVTGTTAVSVDNLTITNGTFNFNLTATPGHSIKGNITVASGATLAFAPLTAGTVNLNGSSTQTISGSGTITSGANSTLVFGNTVIANNNMNLTGALTISATKSFTINPNKQITVTGALTNNASYSGLVIKSDATGTASLIHNTDNVDATVERYLTGNTITLNSYDFHQVSVPFNADGVAGLFNGMYLYHFDQVIQDYVNMGNNPATGLDNNEGFMVFYPNTNTTASMTGQLNNGAFTAFIGTDAVDEFSLVPNPYPSAINWDAVSGWTKTNLQDFFYIWDPVANNYVSWNLGAGTALTPNIPVGQSFFVKASAAAPVLSMTNAVRAHSTQAFWKNTESLVPEVFHLKAYGNESADEILVRFNEQADLNRGFMDIDKLYGAEIAPQLYSLTTNAEKLTTNALNHSDQTIVVPVGLDFIANQNVEFVASGFESFESSVSIFLEDKLLNKTVDLRQNPVYTFTHQTDGETQRFNLLFYGVNGTNELSTEKNYSIWASNDHLNIHIPALTGQKAIVELYDLLGHQVLSQQVNLGSPTTIAVPQFNGMGIVKVISGGNIYSEKVFIR